MKVVYVLSHENVIAWEIKEVKPGFLRNFLLPRGIAFPASEKIIKETADLRREAERSRMEKIERAKKDKSDIEWKTITFIAKTDNLHLYAAITEKDIIQKIEQEFKIELPKKCMKWEKFKDVWASSFEVKLADWVFVKLNIEVISENEKPKVKKEKKEEPKLEAKEEPKAEVNDEPKTEA